TARRRARHVVVRTQGEADSIVRALSTGGDFAALAREHNVDSTRATGGELGWVSRGVMAPACEQALFGLRTGETSGVVRTTVGSHIVQLEEIETVAPPAFEKVADRVKAKLLETQVADFTRQLRAKYPVRVDPAALSSSDR